MDGKSIRDSSISSDRAHCLFRFALGMQCDTSALWAFMLRQATRSASFRVHLISKRRTSVRNVLFGIRVFASVINLMEAII